MAAKLLHSAVFRVTCASFSSTYTLLRVFLHFYCIMHVSASYVMAWYSSIYQSRVMTFENHLPDLENGTGLLNGTNMSDPE